MNKRMILLGGLVLLVLGLLGGGAYTAVQLLTPQVEAANGNEAEAEAPSSGGRVMQSVSSFNGGPPVAVQTTILPALELPAEPSAAFGILASREDNTLLVGTGNLELEVWGERRGDRIVATVLVYGPLGGGAFE